MVRSEVWNNEENTDSECSLYFDLNNIHPTTLLHQDNSVK